MDTELSKLPPPPKGQQGISFNELPPPPKKGKGMTLEEIKNKKTVGQKISNTIQTIFPGKKVGEAIGTLAGATIANFKGIGDQYDLSAPKPTQVAGDALAGAATLAGFKVPGAKTILGSAAQLGSLSAVGSIGAGAAAGKEPDQIIKNALVSGAIGGTLGAATSAIGKGVKALTTKAPERLYNSAIKPTLNETRAAIKYNGQTLGKELIDRGVTGSEKSLLTRAQTELTKNEDKLQTLLSNSTKTIKREELSSYLDDVISKKSNTPGLGEEVDKVRAVLREFPNEVPVAAANEIKRNLYSALNDVAFRLDPNLTTKKEAMKALARGIKTEIENKTADEVGKGVVQGINKELSVFGRLQDRAVDAIARANKNNLLGLGDYGTLAGGAVVGGAPGALAAEGVKRALGSTIFKTNAAVSLSKLGRAIEKFPADSAGKISRAALIAALSRIGNK